MRTSYFEATQSVNGEGFPNWGKFLVGVMDSEYGWRTEVVGQAGSPVLTATGWNPDAVWVLDLQTCEGAAFLPGGLVKADLDKHRVWVCPMFEPFLGWLYEQLASVPASQYVSVLEGLPQMVELPDAPFAFAGYRRGGSAR